jgi:hypothetical protein
MKYTIDDIFNRLENVGQVKIRDKVYRVTIDRTIVMFKHGKSTIMLGKSELYNRWGLGKDGKLVYFKKNLVTREVSQVAAEI